MRMLTPERLLLLCHCNASVYLLPLSYQILPPTGDDLVLRCADGDMCRFGTLTVQLKHKCTRECSGYLYGVFCGVQEKKKIHLKKSALMTHMCQKCAANLGKTELMYKPPIDT